jgi:peptide/nickel transport system substrate-binding protein
MRRARRLLCLVAVLAFVAAACGGDDTNGPNTTGESTGTTAQGDIQPGGTLNLAATGDVSAALDPAKEYYSLSFGYFRCCLLRTLLSYAGVPTDQGGSDLHPDIAADMPTLSDDGLTWTFTLRPDIHYAPPFQDVVVTAPDFVRALEREADPKASANGYSFYYSDIVGFDDFGAGKADSIEGVKAPDDTTLVITLAHPAGDLGYRMALPAMAPIPPNGDARLGAAEGHTSDWGRFLVATGPYMIQGADQVDFSLPAEQQTPSEGYKPGRSMSLVRNPSWDPATDDLRPAYADAINVQIGGDLADLYNKIDSGEVDMVLDAAPPPDVLQRYATDPTLQPRLHIFPDDSVSYISMNLAQPPFDDLAVRKAVNFAIDKAGLRQLRGGETTGDIASHVMVNSLEDNVLQDYDPYATPNSSGDVDLAKEQMKQSKYDTDGDGICDDPVCDNVVAITVNIDPLPKQAALITQNLEAIGIKIETKEFDITTMYSKCNDPNEHVPICLATAWGKDFPDAVTYGPPLFGSEGLYPSCCNYSLVGASPDQLREWGYDVATVPSVDDQFAKCAPLTDDERVQCYADADKYLMENVVPWVPTRFPNAITISSERIINYSFDQFCGCDALDHFAIAPEAQ